MNGGSDWSQVILIVLSIGAVVSPVFFGFTLWKMSQVFISKQEFEGFKQLADSQRNMINGQLSGIQQNVTELLRKGDVLEAIMKERSRRSTDDKISE